MPAQHREEGRLPSSGGTDKNGKPRFGQNLERRRFFRTRPLFAFIAPLYGAKRTLLGQQRKPVGIDGVRLAVHALGYFRSDKPGAGREPGQLERWLSVGQR